MSLPAGSKVVVGRGTGVIEPRTWRYGPRRTCHNTLLSSLSFSCKAILHDRHNRLLSLRVKAEVRFTVEKPMDQRSGVCQRAKQKASSDKQCPVFCVKERRLIGMK